MRLQRSIIDFPSSKSKKEQKKNFFLFSEKQIINSPSRASNTAAFFFSLYTFVLGEKGARLGAKKKKKTEEETTDFCDVKCLLVRCGGGAR